MEALEDECCETEVQKLAVEKELASATHRLSAATAELERQANRQLIQPEGVQELTDQLEVSNAVRATLCGDIAKLTEELVQAKLDRALELSDREELAQKLRRSNARARQLAMRMTELEVQLSASDNAHAEQEEELAQAFREAMQLQERRIRELEASASTDDRAAAEHKASKKKWFGGG